MSDEKTEYVFTIKGENLWEDSTTEIIEMAEWASRVKPCKIEVATRDGAIIATMQIEADQTMERIHERISFIVSENERRMR